MTCSKMKRMLLPLLSVLICCLHLSALPVPVINHTEELKETTTDLNLTKDNISEEVRIYFTTASTILPYRTTGTAIGQPSTVGHKAYDFATKTPPDPDHTPSKSRSITGTKEIVAKKSVTSTWADITGSAQTALRATALERSVTLTKTNSVSVVDAGGTESGSTMETTLSSESSTYPTGNTEGYASTTIQIPITEYTPTDNKTHFSREKSNTTSTETSHPPCARKTAPPSRRTALVCLATLLILGVTASVFLGLSMFLLVRLSVQKTERCIGAPRDSGSARELKTLWAQPKGTVEELVEFWYANGDSISPQRVERVKRKRCEERMANKCLWEQPHVTLEEIEHFWYSNGRVKPVQM